MKLSRLNKQTLPLFFQMLFLHVAVIDLFNQEQQKITTLLLEKGGELKKKTLKKKSPVAFLILSKFRASCARFLFCSCLNCVYINGNSMAVLLLLSTSHRKVVVQHFVLRHLKRKKKRTYAYI